MTRLARQRLNLRRPANVRTSAALSCPQDVDLIPLGRVARKVTDR